MDSRVYIGVSAPVAFTLQKLTLLRYFLQPYAIF